MNNLLLQFLFMIFFLPAISQELNYINGTITDIESGYPISNHAVTIMSDSINGAFYYNVVYTDSVGFYFDLVPVLYDSTVMLYIQTIDCQNYLHQAIIRFNPNSNTYTQDFQICDTVIPCQAYFTFYPEPQGSPDSFQFTDLSTGNIISRLWDFGDGTFSQEQDPLHTYPGPGTFETCLTITSNNCTDTYCATIAISDTVYQQIYGQVFAGNFPAQSAMVFLFALNPNGSYSAVEEGFPADSNGIYYFTLVPSGTYFIQAVPFDSVAYLPTYYGDVINWQQASQVVLGVPGNPYNINLIPAGLITPGPGSVSGQINNGNLNRSQLDKINMMLMNESGVAIGYDKVESSGEFDFPGMDYGTYYLRAELSGVSSDNMKIEISPERPHLEVNLTFSGNSILDVEAPEPFDHALSVYPNPFSDRLTLSIQLSRPDELDIEIYSISGQLVYHTAVSGQTGHNIQSVSLNDFPAGFYTLRVSGKEGVIFVKKLARN